MSISARNIAALLGGTKGLGKRVLTMRDLEAVVAGGLPKTALDTLLNDFGEHYTERSANDMRYQIVPRATYQRVDRFNLQTSETIERIARIYAMALDAFIDPAAATRFMMKAHPELEQRSPFETGLTELGGRAVEEVIERGLHGLPA
jgi:putative toxin-antitoxin system antitoxin component (TIGR02293 family)